MYALEFETDIKSEYIKVPEYNKLKNKHAKILLFLTDVMNNPVDKDSASSLALFKKFLEQRNRKPIVVSHQVNIDELVNEVNNDIF